MAAEQIWWLALGIGAAVIAVVAVLLGLIIATARSIDANASKIWLVGKEIAGNTASLWTLSEVAGATPRIRRAAESLEDSASSIAESVGRRPDAGGRPR